MVREEHARPAFLPSWLALAPLPGLPECMPTTRLCLRHAAGPPQAPRGATLRTAMLEAGVTPHNGRATLINCRGLGTCGTCAVEVGA